MALFLGDGNLDRYLSSTTPIDYHGFGLRDSTILVLGKWSFESSGRFPAYYSTWFEHVRTEEYGGDIAHKMPSYRYGMGNDIIYPTSMESDDYKNITKPWLCANTLDKAACISADDYKPVITTSFYDSNDVLSTFDSSSGSWAKFMGATDAKKISANEISIGSYGPIFANACSGSVYFIAVLDKVLTSTEVEDLYTGTTNLWDDYKDSLVEFWDFQQNNDSAFIGKLKGTIFEKQWSGNSNIDWEWRDDNDYPISTKEIVPAGSIVYRGAIQSQPTWWGEDLTEFDDAVTTGAGSSSGSCTVSGSITGEISSVGDSAGTSNATGVSDDSRIATGNAAGTCTVTGEGGASVSATGTSTCTSTVGGVLAGDFNAVGNSYGLATCTTTPIADAASTGSGSGTSTAGATSAIILATTGSSAGISTCVATSLIDFQAAGSSTGTSTTDGVAAGIGICTGSSAGLATCAGYSTTKVDAETVGSTAGTSTVTGEGAAISAAIGSSAGIAACAGVSDVGISSESTGSSMGASTANGVALGIGNTVGTSTGSSTCTGITSSNVTLEGIGSSKGTSNVTGSFAAISQQTGLAIGTSTVLGELIPIQDMLSTGMSTGISTCLGISSVHAVNPIISLIKLQIYKQDIELEVN